MGKPGLSFTFDMGEVDRASLLDEAASAIGALGGHLGEGGESKEKSLGELVLSFKEDRVKLAAFPDVYKITNKKYLTSRLSVPVSLKALLDDFNFYCVRFPVSLIPREGWGFRQLEFFIEFNPGEERPERRPKAYRIMPENRFQKLLEVSDSLEVFLGENLEFEIGTTAAAKLAQDALEVAGFDAGDGVAAALPAADVKGKLKAGIGLVAGPFTYSIRTPIIYHTSTGLEHVFWRLRGEEFGTGEGSPFIVVLQVPKKTKSVRIEATLQAYHKFGLLAAAPSLVVRYLPTLVRSFFEGGAPIRSNKSWDITARL